MVYGARDVPRWLAILREALPHIAHIVDDGYEHDLLWLPNAEDKDPDFH
jgi:hypothetical protein